MRNRRTGAIVAGLVGATTAATCPPAGAQAVRGPSTLQTPYFIPADAGAGVKCVSIASNGNGTTTPNETFVNLRTGLNTYRLVGAPDGLGVYQSPADLASGTFTLLCNHELTATAGVVRAHGVRGAFVSAWTIRADPNDLLVIGGKDLADTVRLWSTATQSFVTYNSANPMPTPMGRHCSADLAPVSAYQFGGVGSDARLFLNGEETGSSGRAFAYVASGAETGTVYELPWLGKFSRENSVACPYPQGKTVVVGTDDSTPGNVYVYVGTKQAAGSEVDRAGLTNGVLYGPVIAGVTVTAGQAVEDRTYALGSAATGYSASKPFRMFSFGNVGGLSGTDLQRRGDADPNIPGADPNNRVMNWLRPEDAAWDRRDPSVCYFVTTDSFSGNSRLWKLDFSDITQPELGGVVTMLLDGSNTAGTLAGGLVSATGTSDVRMMDNIAVTPYGSILIQEDVGGNARLGRIWLYDIAADRLTEVAHSDPTRFASGGASFLTIDEESSGIVDACGALGSGWYVFTVMAHYVIAGELVEGGQLIALYVPQAACRGDVDCSGGVDQDDLEYVLFNFGAVVPRFHEGDADGDGNVDQDDLDMVLYNYGCGG